MSLDIDCNTLSYSKSNGERKHGDVLKYVEQLGIGKKMAKKESILRQ